MQLDECRSNQRSLVNIRRPMSSCGRERLMDNDDDDKNKKYLIRN